MIDRNTPNNNIRSIYHTIKGLAHLNFWVECNKYRTTINHNTQFTHNTQSAARTLKKCNKPLLCQRRGLGRNVNITGTAGSSSQDNKCSACV